MRIRTYIERATTRLNSKPRTERVVAAVGLVAAIASTTHALANLAPPLDHAFSSILDWVSSLFSSAAHAASPADHATRPDHGAFIREYAPAAFIIGVFVILIGSFWFALFSDKPAAQTAKAWDLIKFICGFFIGTLTNILH